MAAEIRAELERDLQIESLLVGFGHPKGILSVVKSKLGEKDATPETVAEALTGIGYRVEVEDAGSGQDGQQTAANKALADVSALSSSVKSAAGSGSAPSVEQQLSETQDPAQIVEIMQKTGLLSESA